MSETIIGRFASRRDAELAVEHLVQAHGIERTDVFVQPAYSENSVGDKIDGADAESGHPGVVTDATPALGGPIDVSVDVNDGAAETVRTALTSVGGDLVGN